MTRALLVVDVQESFRHKPDWPLMGNPDIARQVARLVDACREAGDLIVWIMHTEPGSGGLFDPENGHVRLMDGLEPRPGEPTVAKTSVNAFTTTNLHQQLTRAGVTDVVVCGIRTEQCCETTARVAGDLGYDVVYVTDATTTSPIPHPDVAERPIEEWLSDPRTLSVADITARTETVLAGREFATIATTADFAGREAALAR
jgi:nicotinamidase-related amidase